MNEEWRRWRGSAYEVSDRGEVRRITDGRRTTAGRLLRLTVMKIGYRCVHPVVNGKNVHAYVHHMVAELFIGPRPVGFDINHIDGNKQNNVVENLEYVSHGDNMRHAHRIGLSPVGERCNKGKLTASSVVAMRVARANGEPLSSIASRFGVAASTASQAINARRWRHV